MKPPVPPHSRSASLFHHSRLTTDLIFVRSVCMTPAFSPFNFSQISSDAISRARQIRVMMFGKSSGAYSHSKVTDQNLDVWTNSSAFVFDALRHYYYKYLSSSSEAAEDIDVAANSKLSPPQTLTSHLYKKSNSTQGDSIGKEKQFPTLQG